MYAVADLRPGDVLLMTSHVDEPWWDAALDAGIRWSTHNPFVHSCLVGAGVLIDPLWHVVTTALDVYAANGWRYTVAGATPAQRRAVVAWGMAHVGQRYGLEELLADGAQDDLHIPISARWHPRYVTCSGFVERAWRDAGIVLSYSPLPSPADLAYSPLLIGSRPAL